MLVEGALFTGMCNGRAVAASLAARTDGMVRRHGTACPAPCQAVPSLCLAVEQADGQRLNEGAALRGDSRMNACRFDARPCRVIGNMDCPKQANRQIFHLGEPIGRTLARSFGLD